MNRAMNVVLTPATRGTKEDLSLFILISIRELGYDQRTNFTVRLPDRYDDIFVFLAVDPDGLF